MIKRERLKSRLCVSLKTSKILQKKMNFIFYFSKKNHHITQMTMKIPNISSHQSYGEIIHIMKKHLKAFFFDFYVLFQCLNDVLTQLVEMVCSLLYFIYFLAFLFYFLIQFQQRLHSILLNGVVVGICTVSLIIKVKTEIVNGN